MAKGMLLLMIDGAAACFQNGTNLQKRAAATGEIILENCTLIAFELQKQPAWWIGLA